MFVGQLFLSNLDSAVGEDFSIRACRAVELTSTGTDKSSRVWVRAVKYFHAVPAESC